MQCKYSLIEIHKRLAGHFDRRHAQTTVETVLADVITNTVDEVHDRGMQLWD
jgi:hypothetical protein